MNNCTPAYPCGVCPFCSEGQAPPAEDDSHDSWKPIDLGPYLRGEIVRPEPTVGLVRSDGIRMLYPGKEHAVVGEMEAGKSWFALACAIAEMDEGHHVVYIHFEESDPSDTVERLLALGADEAQILKLFRFVGPERQVNADVIANLVDPAPSLVIFDGVNEAMSLHGWGIRDEDGAASFRRHIVKPFLRSGAATLACDHVTKDRETRGRYAIGSIHKGNALSGVQIMLEAAEPFGRDQRGRSHVYITKDRPGFLRRNGRTTNITGKTFLGELVVDDTRTEFFNLKLKFWAPAVPKLPVLDDEEDGPFVDPDETAVVEAIRAIAEKGKIPNLRTVRAMSGIQATKTDAAIERLILDDKITETIGARAARTFALTVSQDQESKRAS